MLFPAFIKQLKLCSLHDMPSLYIFTGPPKQVSELKYKGVQLLAALLAGNDQGCKIIKRFDIDSFNEAEFWSELYAVPFFGQLSLLVVNFSDKLELLRRIEGQLIEYLSGKSFFSRLVILTDKWEPLSAELGGLVSKGAWVVECHPVNDEDLPQWIVSQLNIYNKGISLVDARFLAEKTGNDLSKIGDVLEKLVLFHKDSSVITSNSIFDFVDMERDFDIKELTYAVVGRNPGRAIIIAEQLLKKGESVNKIMGFLRVGLANSAKYKRSNLQLLSYYNKLLAADLAIKTGRVGEEAALKSLIIKLTG